MENKPLTIAEAGILYGNKFQLEDKEGIIYNIKELLERDGMMLRKNDKNKKHLRYHIHCDEIGKDYFIRARSLSSLTETIVVEGKEIVPAHEILEMVTGGFWSDDFCSLDARPGIVKITNSIDKIWRGDSKLCVTYKSLDPEGENFWLPPFDQQQLFNYLYSLHFDTMNLEERGLCKIIR